MSAHHPRHIILVLLSGLVAVFLGAALPGVAHADTWCVGGYTGRPPNVVAACNSPAVRARHPRWHEHMWVIRNGECMVCYDEVDNTCETDFLRRHPNFQRVVIPTAQCRQSNTGDQVFRHIIRGEDVTRAPRNRPDTTPPRQPNRPDAAPPPPPPPPPPPAPVAYTPRVDAISPGPYAAGDTITLTGSLRAPDGSIKTPPGGTFTITTDDGQTVRVPATVNRNGTLSARVKLPAAANLRVTFTPDAPRLDPHESVRTGTSAARGITVSACAYRANITSPGKGASPVADQAVPLDVEVVGMDGKPATPAGLSLRYTLSHDAESTEIRASGTTASWTPSQDQVGKTFEIAAGGTAGPRQVCPGTTVTVEVTELGIGLDPTDLPDTCFEGLRCEGTARMVRPDGGRARARVDALLSDPATTIRITDGPDVLYDGPVRPDDRYAVGITPDRIRTSTWIVTVQGPDGDVDLPQHDITVRKPLELKLPEVLDLGTITAGTPFTRACKQLDFSASQDVFEHEWQLEVRGAESCDAQPVIAFENLFGAADRLPLSPAVQVRALDVDRPWLDICLHAPGCAAEDAPPDVILTVTPLTPAFRAQAREVRLTWRVEGASFLACTGWWLLPLLGLLLALFVIYGWIHPHRIPPTVAVRVASSPGNLRRVSAVSLSTLPGAGAGWYRHAQLGLQGSGDLNRQTRTAMVVFRATAAGVMLTGSFELQNPRTRRFERPDDSQTGHPPARAGIYRAGDVYFSVET